MWGRLIKSIGIGFLATGIQDIFFEESPSIYNWIATSAGGVLYLVGTYLEVRSVNKAVPDGKTISVSTQLIKQGLMHTGGLSLVNSITHFAKRVDTNSANVANLSTALFMPSIIKELESADDLVIPEIKWEKCRFILIVTSDYFAASGFKNIMNGSKWDLMSIVSLPIAMSCMIGEWIYGRRNDEGLNLSHAMMRRGIKVAGMMNMIFSVYDFATGGKDKYTIADDIFATIVGALLFAVTVKLSNFCRPNRNAFHLLADKTTQEPTTSTQDVKTIIPQPPI